MWLVPRASAIALSWHLMVRILNSSDAAISLIHFVYLSRHLRSHHRQYTPGADLQAILQGHVYLIPRTVPNPTIQRPPTRLVPKFRSGHSTITVIYFLFSTRTRLFTDNFPASTQYAAVTLLFDAPSPSLGQQLLLDHHVLLFLPSSVARLASHYQNGTPQNHRLACSRTFTKRASKPYR